ncbi:MAG: saccharopine dehydrogenase NADP-binding domain-containing protein [Bacteroidia bacterium]|nr:saccharopine dehydrogenase NADP-binding domain-containing protein [Bacteroidia bacterium]
MKNIIILGAGMVGSAMAIDLSKKHQVTSADINKEALSALKKGHKIKTIHQDLSDKKELAKIIKNYDLVISAVPGFMGFETVKTIIGCKKNLVDISFLPEDILPLDTLAKKNNVTAITDMGVAPGMPNVIIGYYNERMTVTDFEYMVGGLPKVRTFPFEYKAPFSPVDVIEEYTRPARYVKNFKMIVKPAMSDPELIDFEKAGTLEAFNTDGLRSLIYTVSNIPNMKEKTLRYPGHIRLIQALNAAGFFGHEPIHIKNNKIVPFEFTTKLLFKQWKLQPEEPEFTIMRVKVTGVEKKKKKTIVYDLYDEYDPKEKISSMARTTGFTGTAGAELILQGKFKQKGVFPPERVGKDAACFKFILDYLKQRNVIYKKTEI